MLSPITVTPHERPVSITLHCPEWDQGIALYDLEEVRRLAHRMLDAVTLLEGRRNRFAVGLGKRTSAAKSRAARENGKKGGRPKSR